MWHVTICCTYHHTYVCIYNTWCITAGYWHWCVSRSIPMHIQKRIYIYIYVIYIYKYICALPVITTMALWQLMNLGTWCTNSSIKCDALVRIFYTLSGFTMFTVPHVYFLNFLLVAPIFTFLLFNKDKYWKVKKEKTLVQQMRNWKNNLCSTVNTAKMLNVENVQARHHSRAEKTVSMKY